MGVVIVYPEAPSRLFFESAPVAKFRIRHMDYERLKILRANAANTRTMPAFAISRSQNRFLKNKTSALTMAATIKTTIRTMRRVEFKMDVSIRERAAFSLYYHYGNDFSCRIARPYGLQ